MMRRIILAIASLLWAWPTAAVADTFTLPGSVGSQSYDIGGGFTPGFDPAYHNQASLSFDVPAGAYTSAEITYPLGALSPFEPPTFSHNVQLTFSETPNPPTGYLSSFTDFQGLSGEFDATVGSNPQNISVPLSGDFSGVDKGGTIYFVVSSNDTGGGTVPLGYGTSIGPFDLVLTGTATPLPPASVGVAALLVLIAGQGAYRRGWLSVKRFQG